jgi:hypothetical protein
MEKSTFPSIYALEQQGQRRPLTTGVMRDWLMPELCQERQGFRRKSRHTGRGKLLP